MKAAPVFELMETPLARGVNLIEASAGTGKTYTIAGLFLRLVLEENLAVPQILVVTFTEAATQELRDRIRKTLSGALDAFAENASNDPLFQQLLGRHSGARAEMIGRLEQALAGFDEAAIFTIHGFCQRTLKDRAFETGELFDTELILDQSVLLQEIAADFWRRHFYDATPLKLAVALKHKLSPEKLLPLAWTGLTHPFLIMISPCGDRDLDALGADLENAFLRTLSTWREESIAIKALFGRATKWGINPYNSDDKMKVLFAALDDGLIAEPRLEALNDLAWFRRQEMAAKKSSRFKGEIPKHPFFDCCEDFCEAEKNFVIGVQRAFFNFARQELPRRKRSQKVQAFDDLLLRLYHALEGSEGDALAATLRGRYRAALIDEFQDTDPVQNFIFRRTFPDEETFLYLIGDPKQAIYGFRGADIFTYLEASAKAKNRYTLRENWRSESGLVQAVNTFFQISKNPFVIPEITFTPMQAKGPANETPLQDSEGNREAPLQIWFLATPGKNMAKAAVEQKLPGVVASEISRLLGGDLLIGNRPLSPEDVAVLVLENRQAQIMQEALSVLQIPSVLHTTASLFASREAAECERVLAAVGQPGNERLLKSAIGTDLLGAGARAIDELGADERAAQAWLDRFLEYSLRWNDQGFIQMFRFLLQRENVRSRLLTFPDGERRLTNILHLGEVLHEAASTRRLGAAALLKWLAEQRGADSPAAEEHQLRLERDDRAVQLVTVHKSKGLEYNIVFCPFNARSSSLERNHEEEVFFHERSGHALVRDFGGPDFDQHRQLAIEEKLAENVRLLYVALTRARHRCYFAWGAFKDAEKSATAWLLHPPPGENPPFPDTDAKLSPEKMRADLDALALKSCGNVSAPTIQILDLPSDSAPVYVPAGKIDLPLEPRHFTRAIRRTGRIASFSSLTSGQRDETPDRDAVRPRVPVEVPASGIFAFPRGAKVGTCLHKILELLDFMEPDVQRKHQLVETQLRAHGFDSIEFAGAIGQMLDNLVRVPLDSPTGEIVLARVATPDRLNELEFCFPVQHLSSAALNAFFKDQGLRTAGATFEMEPLTFHPVSGFLKGFIDVTFQSDGRFYFADWKSNWLGNSPSDYGPAALHEEMQAQQYHLQLLIYTVAVHKYLSTRVADYRYDTHFGGAFYVFLRGLDPERPELGIYQSRPAHKLVQALAALLSGEKEDR